MKTLLFLFQLLTISLWSASPLDQELPITDVEKNLPTVVAGCVNVISGSYIEQETDLVLPGPAPLVYARSYSSADHKVHSLFRGWRSNHDSIIKIEYSDHPRAYFTELSGRSTQFKGHKRGREMHFRYSFNKRASNCCDGIISAKTNVKNTRLIQSNGEIDAHLSYGCCHFYEYYKRIIVEFEDDYKPSWIDNAIDALLDRQTPLSLYRITGQKNLDGNQILYAYDKKDYLQQIRSTDPCGATVFGKLDLIREMEGKLIRAYTAWASDGSFVRYYLEKFKKHMSKKDEGSYHITAVHRSDAPNVRYKYHRDHHRIIKRMLPDGRERRIRYYKRKMNHLGVRDLSVDLDIDGQDKRLYRVLSLNEDSVTHTFCYHLKKGKRTDGDGQTHKYRGYTSVFDSFERETRYEYDDRYRLTNVMTYRDELPYSSNNYVWDRHNQLICHTIKGQTLSLLSRRFHYDVFGNVTREELYGRIQKDEGLVHLRKDHVTSRGGCDCYCKEYQYSENHLLLSETDNTGFHARYLYYPQTEQIHAKFIYEHDDVLIRYFFEYDELGALCKLIKDDGSSRDPNCLDGVSERSIKYIQTTRHVPYGLPEVIWEKYLDLPSGQEKLEKKTVIHYSSKGKITQKDIYDSDEVHRYSLFWEYDAHGNLIKQVDALGQVTTRHYDQNDNLVFEQGPNQTYHKVFTYDQSNRCRSEDVVQGNQVYSIRHAYDAMGNRGLTTDYNRNPTYYEHDEFGNVIRVRHPEVETIEGQLQSYVECFERDVLGNVTFHTDSEGNRTHKTFNIHGKPFMVEYPDRSKESFQYDLKGRLIKKIAKNGLCIHYTYDHQGRITEEKQNNHVIKSCRYDAFHLLEEKDAEGYVTCYEYDGSGRLIAEQREGQQKTYEYDTLGNQVGIKQWEGKEKYTAYLKEYDLLKRIIREIVSDEEGTIYQQTSYAYDADGNCCLIKKGDQETHTEYDFLKRPLKIVDALGRTTHYEYKYLVKNEHDHAVLQVITTHPSGNQTVVTMNTRGQEACEIQYDPYQQILSKKEMFYSGLGKLTHLKETVFAEQKPLREIVTVWEYQADNLVQLIEAEGSPYQKITTFTYNSHGEKSETLLPNGCKLSYRYDFKGRLKRLFSSDGSIDYSYSYNHNDQPVEAQDHILQTTVKRKYDHAANIVKEVLPGGYILSYCYDEKDRLIRFYLPDRSSVHYLYDAVNLRQIDRYDVDGTLCYSHKNLSYDSSGNLLEVDLPGKCGQIHYAYDALFRLTATIHREWSQTIDAFDDAGNLTHYTLNGKTHQFSYDALNQLVKETDHSYQYDSVHNRLAKDDMTFTYNELNHIHSPNYTYDLNGNLTRNHKTSYTYDALGRLTKVIENGVEHTYTYDAFNRRLCHTAHDISTDFIYMGQNEIGSYCPTTDKQLSLRILETPTTDIGSTVAIEIDHKIYIPLHDIHGNICILLEQETGECIESYAYTAFGVQKCANTLSPWRYASKRIDQETGLVYFGMRFYHPTLGRWLNPDPAGFTDGPNLYAYVQNNPLSYIDHQGLSSSTIWDLGKAMLCVLFQAVGITVSYDTYGACYAAPFTTPVHLFGPPRQLSEAKAHHKTPMVHEVSPGEGLICFINGILNDEETFIQSLEYITQMSGDTPVVGIHHQTCVEEGLCDDALRYLTYRFSSKVSNASKALINTWTAYCEEHPDKNILQICHSEGAVHVKNALSQCPQSIRSRIDVLVIAGGTYISKRSAHTVEHFISSRDFIPSLDFFGKRMAKAQGTLHILKPHPQAPWFDHSFMSPTYRKDIKTTIDNYRGYYA